MARMVATKAALSIRVDALTDSDGKSDPMAPSIGIENRAKLESRLRALEYQEESGVARRFGDGGKKQERFSMTGETKTYNNKADAVEYVPTQREDPMEVALKAQEDIKEEKRKAKEEKKKKKAAKESTQAQDDDNRMDVDEEKSEKKSEKKSKKDKEKKRKRESNVGALPIDGVVPTKEIKVS